MLNLRTLAALTALGILAIGMGASSKQPHFNTRWSRAMTDLAQTQPGIPQEKLHARAVEILRSMTVAEGQ